MSSANSVRGNFDHHGDLGVFNLDDFENLAIMTLPNEFAQNVLIVFKIGSKGLSWQMLDGLFWGLHCLIYF